MKLENIQGFILNVPSEYKFGFVSLPIKRRHWIAIKKIDGAFYNLDSKIEYPELIGKVSIEFHCSILPCSFIQSNIV